MRRSAIPVLREIPPFPVPFAVAVRHRRVEAAAPAAARHGNLEMTTEHILMPGLPSATPALPRLRLMAGGIRRRPHLFVNPASDHRFVARVEGFVGAGIADPTRLADALRANYPAVAVRRREISGSSTRGTSTATATGSPRKVRTGSSSGGRRVGRTHA